MQKGISPPKRKKQMNGEGKRNSLSNGGKKETLCTDLLKAAEEIEIGIEQPEGLIDEIR
jgi:hypothetical protein